MRELSRLIRRWVIRWQLRNLDRQVQTIVEAQQSAKTRLKEIKLERDIKEVELWMERSLGPGKIAM